MLDKYTEIENVLGECFDINMLTEMENDWNAFYNNPSRYANTVVVDMVNQWIDEKANEVYKRAFK